MERLIEQSLLLPIVNKQVQEITEKMRRKYIIMYTKSYIRKWLYKVFGKENVTNVQYRFCTNAAIHDNCHCCGNGENCGKYDFEYLEIGFDLATDEGKQIKYETTITEDNSDYEYTSMFDMDKPMNTKHTIKFLKHKYHYFHIFCDDVMKCPDKFYGFNYDHFYRKNNNKKSITVRGIRFNGKKGEILLKIPYKEEYDPHKYDPIKYPNYSNAIASKVFEYYSNITGLTMRFKKLMKLQDIKEELIDSTFAIWIDKVVILILCANKFDEESVFHSLPKDITKIIAKNVYSQINYWIDI